MTLIQSLLVKNKPLKLHVGLEQEFKDEIPDKHRLLSNGCADSYVSTAWIFIDNIVSQANIYHLDIWPACLYCKNGIVSYLDKGTKCLEGCNLNVDPRIGRYSQEISRVTIHELLHLCGIHRHNAIGALERNLIPMLDCLHYEPWEAE